MSYASEPRHHAEPSASWGERFGRAGFIVCVGFLVFVIGSLSADQNWLASQWVRDASSAAQALIAQTRMNSESCPPFLWFPATTDQRGLTQSDESRMQPGYTLYTAADSAQAILLDEQGHVAHRWEAPFSQVWPQGKQVSGWLEDRSIYIRRAHVFPNGDLLALYESPAHTPNGCGMARLDRDGKVLWTFDENTHHDFCLADNGAIVTLTHDIRREPRENWRQLATPIVDEFVTILTPDGELVKSISLLDALGKSPFYVPAITHSDQMGDVLHSNTVKIAGSQFASHYPEVEPGDLIVCLRNLDLVLVLRPESEEVVWATTGPWRLPHDPDPLDNGNLLIFDNCFARGSHQGSRVIEFDPRTGDIVWEYAGSSEAPLRSDIRSCQQRLANGNVLINESDYGRLLEVTENGEIVWEFVHPVRGGEGDSLIPVASGARRYGKAELPFLGSP